MEAERRMPNKVSNEENSRIHCSHNNHALDTKPLFSSSSSFDCSVCLDCAVDPVVTLCGHLYCWPCIYKWLSIDSTCPVCKSLISQNRLIPLYSRDSNNINTGVVTKKNCLGNIPSRPRFVRNGLFDQQHVSSPMQYSSMSAFSMAGGVFMCLVTAILPLVTRNSNHQENMNFVRSNQVGMIGDYSNENQRLREREVENSLHHIWMFLLLCAVLWWLSF